MTHTAPALPADLEAVIARATTAAPLLATTTAVHRARALVAIADALETAAPDLVDIALRETGLT
ncbi:aldehyde dehydrogenase family protein, partial [Leucobacter chromiiresistens]